LLGGSAEVTSGDVATISSGLKTLDINLLFPSPYQPRQVFSEEAINDLVESIKEKGVLQPLLVRKSADKEGMYEIIAGERRWRASKQAGLAEVPVIEKEFTDVETLEVALIENLQRQDLSALEEAEGYQRLIDEFEHTQEKLATVVGKSRSHVANTLRLLALPAEIKELVQKDKLSAGHARALLGCDNAVEVASEVVAKELNVRQTEALVKKINAGIKDPVVKTKKEKDADIMALEEELTGSLGMKVQIEAKENSGKVIIAYSGLGQLDKILQRLGGAFEENEVSIAEQTPVSEDDTWAKALAPDMGDKDDVDSASLMTDAEDSWGESEFENYEEEENYENNLNDDNLAYEVDAEGEDEIVTLGEQLHAQDEIAHENDQYSIEDYIEAENNAEIETDNFEATNVVNEELTEEAVDNIEENLEEVLSEVDELEVVEEAEFASEEALEWEETELLSVESDVEPQIDGEITNIDDGAEDVAYETIDIADEEADPFEELAEEVELVEEDESTDFEAISEALTDIQDSEEFVGDVETDEIPLDEEVEFSEEEFETLPEEELSMEEVMTEADDFEMLEEASEEAFEELEEVLEEEASEEDKL